MRERKDTLKRGHDRAGEQTRQKGQRRRGAERREEAEPQETRRGLRWATAKQQTATRQGRARQLSRQSDTRQSDTRQERTRKRRGAGEARPQKTKEGRKISPLSSSSSPSLSALPAAASVRPCVHVCTHVYRAKGRRPSAAQSGQETKERETAFSQRVGPRSPLSALLLPPRWTAALGWRCAPAAGAAGGPCPQGAPGAAAEESAVGG